MSNLKIPQESYLPDLKKQLRNELDPKGIIISPLIPRKPVFFPSAVAARHFAVLFD